MSNFRECYGLRKQVNGLLASLASLIARSGSTSLRAFMLLKEKECVKEILYYVTYLELTLLLTFTFCQSFDF